MESNSNSSGIPAPPRPEADANVLWRYVDELRKMNASKNEEIERLEAAREGWAKESDLWKMRYEAAQAKLDDLSALHRVMSMAKASTTEDWDFSTLMADVLARG